MKYAEVNTNRGMKPLYALSHVAHYFGPFNDTKTRFF